MGYAEIDTEEKIRLMRNFVREGEYDWMSDDDEEAVRRAQILSFSGQGMRVQEISSHLEMNEEYLRELIRRFNDEGFDALRQKTRSGRPPKLTEEEESIIAEIATAPPQAMGRPFNQWH